MWRWAFLPPQFQDRDELYGSFWRSLVRWLVANVGLPPSQRMALRTDKLTFSTDENATATLLIRENQWTGEAPWVELSGAARRQVRGPSSACRRRRTPGQYHVPTWAGCRKGNTSRGSSAPKGRTLRRDRLRRPRQLEGAARRCRPADVMKLDRRRKRRRGVGDADVARLQRQFDEHLARSRPERVTRTSRPGTAGGC